MSRALTRQAWKFPARIIYSPEVGTKEREPGHYACVDPERYGDLTDEFEQMYSAEALPRNGSVIISGDIDDLVSEMIRYLVTQN